jgi:aspartate kinase
MRSHAGVAAKVFCALADQGINIQMISTSEIKITCVVASEDAERATRVLHDAFDLGGAEVDGAP